MDIVTFTVAMMQNVVQGEKIYASSNKFLQGIL